MNEGLVLTVERRGRFVEEQQRRVAEYRPGDGESLAQGEVRALEESVAARFPEALSVIRAERMNPERRALRLRVQDLEHEYTGDVLRLRFALSSGSFATTVLREIIAAGTGE